MEEKLWETKNGGEAIVKSDAGNENGGEVMVGDDAINENGGDEDGAEDEGIGRHLGEPEEVPYWYYSNFGFGPWMPWDKPQNDSDDYGPEDKEYI